MNRIFLFLMTNIVVMVVGSTVINLVMNFFGMGPYLTANGINYQSLMVICLIWGMVGSFISLWMSKFVAKRAYGVQIVEANGPYARIVHKVHQMARDAGISKMPEVGVYESAEVNAFATGPSKNNSLVAVSTGLLDKMNDREVEGVLAHEIAHVANGDMVTMTLVQGVVNAFVMFLSRLAVIAIENMMRGDDDERGGGLGFITYMILNNLFHIIFGFLASPIIYWFSRYREYRADEGGARLAGKDSMIAALEALQRMYPVMQEVEAHGNEGRQNKEFRAMQISSTIKMSEIFSTHPTLDKRINALKNARL